MLLAFDVMLFFGETKISSAVLFNVEDYEKDFDESNLINKSVLFFVERYIYISIAFAKFLQSAKNFKFDENGVMIF